MRWREDEGGEWTTSLLCQQLLSGPFSAICTNQWKWIWFPPGSGSGAANLSPQLPLRPGSRAHYCRHEGGRRRRQVNVVTEENVRRWQHSLQGDYYPWFIILIYCRCRCFLARSLSAAATLPLFTPSHLHFLPPPIFPNSLLAFIFHLLPFLSVLLQQIPAAKSIFSFFPFLFLLIFFFRLKF